MVHLHYPLNHLYNNCQILVTIVNITQDSYVLKKIKNYILAFYYCTFLKKEITCVHISNSYFIEFVFESISHERILTISFKILKSHVSFVIFSITFKESLESLSRLPVSTFKDLHSRPSYHLFIITFLWNRWWFFWLY